MNHTYRFLINLALITALLATTSRTPVFASHLRAGEIIVQNINCPSPTFKITITVYVNTKSPVKFGGLGTLYFGDGTSVALGEIKSRPMPELGTDDIGIASFSTTHVYGSSHGTYIVSYREDYRNEGVVNMDHSGTTSFYLETMIRMDGTCNHSPTLGIPPIDQACTGVAFFHNPGAVDTDLGDSISYELVTPYSDRGLPVVRYQDPNDNTPRTFYLDYAHGNEDKNGVPEFSIDQKGNLVWNSPGMSGEYNIAFVVKEWRRDFAGNWVNIGYVRRDMQIQVTDCNNERPDLILPEDLCVEAGTYISKTIRGIDPDNDYVKIEAFSEVLDLAPAQYPANYNPRPAVYEPSSPPYELQFEWGTRCLHVRDKPYIVVFKITDQPRNGPRLVTFKTWSITVVGPAPGWEGVTLNSDRSATVNWSEYTCNNADSIQIWRRVSSNPYMPEECETGMPPGLGYELIAKVRNNSSSVYIDTNNGEGLAPGAKYCYRLIAQYPAAESYVSWEYCTDPVPAEAPVITHVTVDKTDQAAGEITVRWREPFDIPAGTYAEPYRYRVLRGTGSSARPTVVVNTTLTTLLTVTDVNLNTTDHAYNYAVVCYDNNEVPIDTSFAASSVRLEAEPQFRRIVIDWSAQVPWSNNLQQYSRHLIYRGNEGAIEGQMVLIDSVDVTTHGFKYTDEGKYNNIPLEDNKTYCYRIMTRGGYGNPNIAEPLENFSQIICAQPSDTIPPCQVATPVAIDAPDCNNYLESCGQALFQNKILWEHPATGDCQDDIAYYNIYVAYVQGGVFSPYATHITETSFNDVDLPSHAKCYKVAAVDRSGNEGPMSEAVCIDNCPYYELPNIFTPNGDLCNDVFSAYNNRPVDGGGEQGAPCPIPPEIQAKCARFVEKVNFKVYNRWGKEVYSYESGEERTIFIDWNGRDNKGSELSSGIYYYSADVTFTTIDPEKRHQIIKGWVHLLR